MPSISDVIDMMERSGLPPLPPNHPICDGKERRFGPKKKAWYKFNQVMNKEGKEVVYGVYGFWRGTENGAVGVSLDAGEVTKEALEEARARQEAAAQLEIKKREQAAQYAANRAKSQWAEAEKTDPDGTAVSPYLERKRVTRENVRVAADGLLLVPMKRYSLDGTKLVGLQKITPAGDKLFNKGMDKIGAACLLGKLSRDVPLIGMAEGYATGRSIRMAVDLPLMVAFDAGNLLPVSQGVRRDFPDAHLLFFADDDWQLEQRAAKCLLDEFKVSDLVEVGSGECKVSNADGETVTATLEWRKDANGVAFIEADIRIGKAIHTRRFENAGIAKAKEAAKKVGNASVVWPEFRDRGQHKWTDFNDLHVEESLEAVLNQVTAALQAVECPHSSAPPAQMLDDAPADVPTDADIPPHLIDIPPPSPDDDVERPTINAAEIVVASADDYSSSTLNPSPSGEKPRLTFVGGKESGKDKPAKRKDAEAADDAAPEGKGGEKKVKKRGKDFWDTVDYLLEHFVLLYGTNTAWDRRNRMQIKITDLRYAYGSEPVKFWLGNGDRKMINHDRLVFDPTETCDPKTHENLFEGFKVVPKKGDCSKILGLLKHLCEGNEEIVLWILRWIAYPLRHPGAKMTTSVLMHGDEGSGKNLFWEEIVGLLYGEYGGVIGNAQIETQYNEWASKKLFFVCDEVVTRNELAQLKGKLKAMISGKRINVNPKHLPERREANHMNFVFLSNEIQPIALDQSDRRYLVLWTPPKKDKPYYLEVAQQAFAGGIEAFYHMLLHEIDMGDFNEHTAPPMTEAKQELIKLGLGAPERFYEEWAAQALPLPFVTCSAMQLYAAFQRWCTLNGERFPPSHTYFGRKVIRHAGSTLRKKMIEYELGSAAKQRTVYMVGEKPADKSLMEWAAGASQLFEGYLRKYRHVYGQSEEQG